MVGYLLIFFNSISFKPKYKVVVMQHLSDANRCQTSSNKKNGGEILDISVTNSLHTHYVSSL
jgi:hypothetical protein